MLKQKKKPNEQKKIQMKMNQKYIPSKQSNDQLTGPLKILRITKITFSLNRIKNDRMRINSICDEYSWEYHIKGII